MVSAIIEVPAGSNVKYELDRKSGLLRADRTLFSSVHYPANFESLHQSFNFIQSIIDLQAALIRSNSKSFVAFKKS
ncbi:MAG: inorganic diphosphatase [Cyanobacteria bacterium TGS_CYA1]|nr:inorganic diphosphatase [Cyanobacteria bacterium TGS_CYA1]